MKRYAILATAALVGLLVGVLPAMAQRISEEQARAFAERAAANAKGEEKTFHRAFVEQVKRVMPKYQGGVLRPTSYNYRVVVGGQLATFEERAAEAVRKLQDIADVDWPEGPVVSIDTSTMSGAVEGIALRRDGEIVRPIEEAFYDTVSRNLLGAEVPSRAGSVTFEHEAFSVDSKTTIDILIIPRVGENSRVRLLRGQATRIFTN